MAATNYDPKYDEDQITFGYLKKVLGDDINKRKSNETESFIRNYGSKPNPPYQEGDTWTTDEYVYTCMKTRKMGLFDMDDWTITYDKKTNEILNKNLQFLGSVQILNNESGKVQTYYLEDYPSNPSYGDYFQNSKTFKTYIYKEEGWEEINVTSIIFDMASTHKNIFIKQPNAYQEGDIWKVVSEIDAETLNCSIGDFYKALNSNTIFNKDDFEKISDELSLKANIYSSAGIKVVDGNMLSNLQYVSSGQYNDYSLLGFNKYITRDDQVRSYSDIAIDIDLPDNFKVVSAYLSLFNTPVYWSYWNQNTGGYGDNWGYARNLKLYKLKSQEKNFKLYMSFANEYRYELSTNDLEVINNAFKQEKYTPSNQSGTSIERKDTINIKSYLNATGKTKLVVRTADSVPSDDYTLTAKTGMARAVVNILGYVQIKE